MKKETKSEEIRFLELPSKKKELKKKADKLGKSLGALIREGLAYPTKKR